MSGNDDQRMKDLTDRLVAMSPEPPPFPEEIAVTQPVKSKPSPIVMFAGAAIVVLILAAIPIILFNTGGDEVPPVGTSTTTSSVPASTVTTEPSVTSTTQAPVTTTTPDTSSTTVLAGEPADAVLYLVQTPENSFTGNPALVAFAGVAMSGADPISPALPGLSGLTDPGLIPPEGFSNMVPSDVDVVGVTLGEHMITVDMNEAFLAGSGSGLLGDFTMLNQLIYTAAHFGEIESVLFTVNDQPVTEFGTDGLDLSEPVSRESFLDQVNSIMVTNPVQGQDGAPLVISGAANVFEATVSYEVLGSDGSVIDEGFTTATCGTGCWGGFSIEVQGDFAGDETVRVFVHSAEDGEPADVVTIPILWNDPDGWPFLP